MSKFAKVPLGKAALSIIDGDRGANYPKKTEFLAEGHCWFLNTSNVKSAGFDFSEMDFITAEKDAALSKGKLRRHDIVLTTRGTIGNCAYFGDDIPFEDIRINSGMVVLRAEPSQLDPYFLYAFLRSEIFKIQTGTHSSGSAQPQLPISALRNIVIPLFELAHQRKIAAVLSALDAKIALNHRINSELEGMAKLLYDYWFVQYDFPLSAAQAAALGKPRLTGKPYRSSGGPMVYHDQLKREIPKGWESGTAKDLFIFNPSISIKKGAVAAYLDMDALSTTGFMTKQIQRKEFNGGTKFTNGDVLVARITPCLENGKTGLVSLLEDKEMAFGSTEFIVLRGRSLPLSSFACCLSRSDYFRKYAIGNMTGTSGRKRLEAPILEKLPLSIPPTETLASFEKICHPLFTLMTEHTKQNQELTNLRDWLLPMLMNGQVRVTG